MTGKGKARAVIWDMDGVIADTGPYHLRAWQAAFGRRGVNFTAEDFRRNFGHRNDAIIQTVLGDQIAQTEIEAIAQEKEETYRNLVKENIKPLPGALELLRSLKANGFRIALGSSAPMENIQLVLQGLGIDSYFQATVSGREVTEGKPSPQGFLLAAKKLGVDPAGCIVVEDAIAGVTACKRAGMCCLAVTNTHPREKLAQADLVVDSLEEVTTADLENLLDRRF